MNTIERRIEVLEDRLNMHPPENIMEWTKAQLWAALGVPEGSLSRAELQRIAQGEADERD